MIVMIKGMKELLTLKSFISYKQKQDLIKYLYKFMSKINVKSNFRFLKIIAKHTFQLIICQDKHLWANPNYLLINKLAAYILLMLKE